MSTIAQPIFEDDADIDIWEVKKNNIKKIIIIQKQYIGMFVIYFLIVTRKDTGYNLSCGSKIYLSVLSDLQNI